MLPRFSVLWGSEAVPLWNALWKRSLLQPCLLLRLRSFVSSLLNSRSSAVFHVADCGQITWQSFNSKSLTALHFYHTFLFEVNLTKKHLMFFIMEKGGWSSWDFRVVMSIYVKQLPKSLFNWWEKHTHIEKTRRNNEIMTFCRTVDSVNLLYRINWYQRPIKCCKGSMFCLESASFSFANDGLRIRAEASVAPFQAIIKGKM